MKLLALDFGGSSVKFSLIDENKVRTNEGKLPPPKESREAFGGTIQKLSQRFRNEIEGIAISMPGYIDPVTGYIDGAGSYFAMMHTNLYEFMKEYVDVPVAVENDGKSAALAEVWDGALKDVDYGCVCVIGTGIAGGIVKNGKVFRGIRNMAGEFSAMGFTPDVDFKNTAAYTSAMLGLTMKANLALGIDLKKTEYAEMAAMYDIKNDFLGPMNEDPRYPIGIDGKMFFRLLDEGNTRIESIYREFIKNLATSLMTIQGILDTEVIALGGAVIQQERIIPDLQEQVKKFDAALGGGLLPHINIRRCRYSYYANEIGAVYNWLQLHKKIF